MAVYRHYECPDCLGTFKFLHHPAEEPPPNFCPLCGQNMKAEPIFVPTAPHIARSIGKTSDSIYRQIETASAERAELAAELGGGEAKDYTALKVTNMNDYLRPGDIAAKLPPNPVSQAMAATGQGGFRPLGGMTGAEFALGTRSGPVPHRGEAMRQLAVGGHAARARAVETAGRLARAK